MGEKTGGGRGEEMDCLPPVFPSPPFESLKTTFLSLQWNVMFQRVSRCALTLEKTGA